MSSPHPPDFDGAHGAFPNTPTSSAAHSGTATTMQKLQFGNVLFAIALTAGGVRLRMQELPATDYITNDKLDMDLAKMDLRRSGCVRLGASARAGPINLWSHGITRMEFELRIDNPGR